LHNRRRFCKDCRHKYRVGPQLRNVDADLAVGVPVQAVRKVLDRTTMATDRIELTADGAVGGLAMQRV
jgi:predicted trehalose synthase